MNRCTCSNCRKMFDDGNALRCEASMDIVYDDTICEDLTYFEPYEEEEDES